MRERTERIREMEQRMERSAEALAALEKALDVYERALPGLRALEDYLSGAERREDLAADEAGMLPPDLKRGVLSEDGLFDLLETNDALRRKMARLGKKTRKTDA